MVRLATQNHSPMSHTGIARKDRSARARHRNRRPCVEVMEPRFLLTAYLVQSAADDGSVGTLRWAVNQVNEIPAPARSTSIFPARAFSESRSSVRCRRSPIPF